MSDRIEHQEPFLINATTGSASAGYQKRLFKRRSWKDTKKTHTLMRRYRQRHPRRGIRGRRGQARLSLLHPTPCRSSRIQGHVRVLQVVSFTRCNAVIDRRLLCGTETYHILPPKTRSRCRYLEWGKVRSFLASGACI